MKKLFAAVIAALGLTAASTLHSAGAAEKLEIGYMPILPVAQVLLTGAGTVPDPLLLPETLADEWSSGRMLPAALCS